MKSQKLTGSESVHADDRKDQSDVHVGDPGAEMLDEKAVGYQRERKDCLVLPGAESFSP